MQEKSNKKYNFLTFYEKMARIINACIFAAIAVLIGYFTASAWASNGCSWGAIVAGLSWQEFTIIFIWRSIDHIINKTS